MLTYEERARVRQAVTQAEAGLEVEIVPCVFAQSSSYPETVWAGAAAGCALACAGLWMFDVWRPSWQPLSTLILCVPAAGLLGAAVGRWFSPVKRWLIGAPRLEQAVARQAKAAFFDHHVSGTKQRDGVMIFLSLLERRAVILADEAFVAKVDAAAWRPAVDALTSAAARGRVADGLMAAVAAVAKAVKNAGLNGENGDELDDEPVEGEGEGS